MAAATTTQDQINAQNGVATATANQSVLGTQQAPAATAASQPGIIAGGMGANAPDYSSQVKNLYRSDLGREADAGGVDFWAGQMKNGASASQIDAALRASPEYASLHQAPTQATAPAAPSYTPALLGNPTKWDVANNQTVQGQMAALADPNNPYYQQWATAGAQNAAARGFTGNSSIRDTGILDSVMRNATPVAQSDAATYAKAAGYNADQSNQFAVANQNATNTAGQVNANLANTANIAKLQSDTTRYGADVSAGTQRYVSDQSASTQQAIAKMSNTSQAAISQAHDANSVLLQNNQTAQAAYNAYVNAVANIDIQPSMDAAAKQAAITTQTQIFNATISGLKTATPATPDVSSPLNVNAAAQQVNGVDVSNLLNF